jgi:hypothetical protein
MKITKLEDSGIFVVVDRTEALEIIQSLSNQILANSSNNGRKESYAEGKYFSIAVTPEKGTIKQNKLKDILALTPEKYIKKYGEDWAEEP